jgi:hypothetical protein
MIIFSIIEKSLYPFYPPLSTFKKGGAKPLLFFAPLFLKVDFSKSGCEAKPLLFFAPLFLKVDFSKSGL